MAINPNSVFDEISSDKVVLVCGKHNYTAARKRTHATVAIPPETRGCAKCWEVYYITDLALTDPDKRKERLDELETVIRHAVEFEEKGTFGKDFELFEPEDKRFSVEVEKDAIPDKEGEN